MTRRIVFATLLTAAWAAPSPAEEKARVTKEIANSIGMKLNLLPAGGFDMGSPDSDKDADPDEKPRHSVTISRPFYMGQTAVTHSQFRRFVEETGHRTDADRDGGGYGWNAEKETYEKNEKFTWRNPGGFEQTDEHPVVQVSWNDAVAFIIWLTGKEKNLTPVYRKDGDQVEVDWNGTGYRLPTEAEREYACRAGNPSRYSFGDDPARLGAYAWFADNSGRDTWDSLKFWKDHPGDYLKEVFRHGCATHPVGKKHSNDFGLFDMQGNTWEWCWDFYDNDYYKNKSSNVDPKGPEAETARVLRGGSWYDDPSRLRAADRLGIVPAIRDNSTGFRLSRTCD